MKTITSKIQPGTKVKIEGITAWRTVKSRTKTHVQLKGLEGSFQKGHILKFTNK